MRLIRFDGCVWGHFPNTALLSYTAFICVFYFLKRLQALDSQSLADIGACLTGYAIETKATLPSFHRLLYTILC